MIFKACPLSQEYLKKILHYDPQTGSFTWKEAKSRKQKSGDTAGCEAGGGYRVITIDYVAYAAHRLAWLYTHGAYPSGCLDHINGLRDDNRIENLRECTHRENALNRERHRKGLLPGVVFSCANYRKKPWHIRIFVDGKWKHVKYCASYEEGAKYLKENYNVV